MTLTIIDEGIVWKNPHPAARSLVALKGYSLNLGGGTVLHSLQIGQARQSRDSRCVMLRSDDYGKTWQETTPLISRDDEDPGYAYGRAMLSRTSDGSIWASSLRMALVEPEDERWTGENCGWIGAENFLCRSTDEGLTWSKPQYVSPAPPRGGFPVLSSPVHELAGGELMLVFEPFFTGTLGEMQHEVSAIYSRDGGTSWGEQSVIAGDPTGRIVYFDPRMTRFADGRWVCLIWMHDKQADQSLPTGIAFSEDGYTWSTPRLTTLWGFLSLPMTLPDGRLLAVFNHRRDPPGVRCAVSEDAGETWDPESEFVLWDQCSRSITGERAGKSEERWRETSTMTEMFTWDFGTPYPVLLSDGTVLVTFYATQWDHIMHERYVRFSIE